MIDTDLYNNWPFAAPGLSDAEVLALVAKRGLACYTETGGWKRKGITPARIHELNPDSKDLRITNMMLKPWNDGDVTPGQWTPKFGDFLEQAIQFPIPITELEDNDWWLRDTAGDIVLAGPDPGTAPRCVDVGKPGVKEAYLSNLIMRLEMGFAGVLTDAWWPAVKPSWFPKGRTYRHYQDDMAWFQLAWQPFVQHLSESLHASGLQFFGNCAGQYGTTDTRQVWQRTQVDGTVQESGAFGFSSTGGAWKTAEQIEAVMQANLDDPLGLLWSEEGGVRAYNDPDGVKRRVSLAAYLASLPMDHQNRRWYNVDGRKLPTQTSSVGWDSAWDSDLGEPLFDIYGVSSDYQIIRPYEKGVVLLNLGQEPLRYYLGRRHKDVHSGVEYDGTIMVPPKDAAVLVRA